MIGILLGLEEDPSEEFTTFSDKLQGYFVTKAVSREMDPLTWWQTNQHNYRNYYFQKLQKVCSVFQLL